MREHELNAHFNSLGLFFLLFFFSSFFLFFLFFFFFFFYFYFRRFSNCFVSFDLLFLINVYLFIPGFFFFFFFFLSSSFLLPQTRPRKFENKSGPNLPACLPSQPTESVILVVLWTMWSHLLGTLKFSRRFKVVPLRMDIIMNVFAEEETKDPDSKRAMHGHSMKIQIELIIPRTVSFCFPSCSFFLPFLNTFSRFRGVFSFLSPFIRSLFISFKNYKWYYHIYNNENM